LRLEEFTMPSNGPYPGPPSQPWSGEGEDEPYTEPADPWSEHTTASGPSPWAAHAAPGPAGHDASMSYPAYATADPPTWPPAPRRRNGPIVALVVVLGVLILGGLGTTAWLLVERGKHGSPQARPSATGPTSAANVAGPQPSEDARFVKKGECVRNEGTAQNPAMTIVPCTSGTYEVLRRIDGPTTGETDAESKCSKVPEYTKWYFYDSELDSLDFVLCLRER
jgi:hypothetical protein